SDTGCGISEENQKRMFVQAFSTKKEGSGIGMVAIKTIVSKDLYGSIEVESYEGMGSKFVITIPIKSGEDNNYV
ncbi:MAG: hypothetical protein RL536_545, partial [Candidatus Parcubacteria bacterium]